MTGRQGSEEATGRRAGLVPPHDLPAEESMIGAALTSRQAAEVLVEELLPSDFYRPAHQHIASAVTSLFVDGEPVDPVTVSGELDRIGLGAEAGGLPYLVELMSVTPAVTAAGKYADRIVQTSRLRRLLYGIGDVTDLIYHQADLSRIVDALATVQWTADVGRSDRERFHRHSVKDLLAADMAYAWDATGLLLRSSYGADAGELKTLKSYFALARAIGLAAGVPILDHWPVAERRRVLMYVAEGGRIPFVRRLRRMAEAHRVDVADLDGWLHLVFDAGPLDSSTFRSSLRGHLRDIEPGFVHLDPLYPFQPSSVDSFRLSEVGAMLTDTQAFCADHGATFWITAHMNQTGTGFGLKRISGAGVAEWADSWVLMEHRETADVASGRFRLKVEIGSRQWGGATHHLDWNIGRFDPDAGTHDGPLTFTVRPAGDVDRTDADSTKRLAARRGVFKAMRAARSALTVTEIKDRSSGASDRLIRAEILALIDAGQLVQVGERKPEGGGKSAPTYVLSKDAGDA